MKKTLSEGLVGQFVHFINEEERNMMLGAIIKAIGPDHVLILFYSWLTGFPENEQIVSVQELVGLNSKWGFHESAEDLNCWFQARGKYIERRWAAEEGLL